jgi:hypothetical protein
MRMNVITQERREESRVEEERRIRRRRGGGGYQRLGGALLGGLLGGAVFIALEMILISVISGQSPWGPPGMIAAIIMGRDVLPAPGTPPAFNLNVVVVGLAFHFGLSILYGLTLAAIVARINLVAAAVVGIAFGIALYFINFYGFTEIFPWFAMARSWITILTHALFGLTAASIYVGVKRAGSRARG